MECYELHFLTLDGSCTDNCGDGFLEDGGNKKCVPCDKNCKTCNTLPT